MNENITLTPQQARALQLAVMGLLTPPPRRAKKTDVLRAIRAMNVLQIDTISIVARSPYLVLWSRLGDYPSCWLDELLTEGSLFEYWAHAACFLPIEDYPYYRRQMLHLEAAGSMRSARQLATDPVAHLDLLEYVREAGPVRAAEFEHTEGHKSNGWWDWKPDKLRLETLFTAGELMVRRRENFHRVYDVRDRVLPQHLLDDDQLPDRETVARHWTLAAIHALGIAPARWIGDYFRHAGRVAKPHPDELLETGLIKRVQVQGWPWPAYVHADHAALLHAAYSGKLRPSYSTVLSPFDPLVWDRERVLHLFDFDYRIECYTPLEKRKYGYFTLPLLIRGDLVGRVDAKARRTDGIFEIRALHLEPRIKPAQELATEIADVLFRCAHWHGTPRVDVLKVVPSAFRPMLQRAVRLRQA